MLKEIGVNFEVKVLEEIEEAYPDNLSKTEIPVYLAELKAKAFKNIIHNNTLLITADTIVWMNNRVIGKPVDKEDAIRLLKKLAGIMHQVITGVCITTVNRTTSFYAMSDVYFSKLTDEEINYYIDTFKPYDKAGAYGIQEFIGYIGVERIEGSFFNVMGLPIHKLYNELKKF